MRSAHTLMKEAPRRGLFVFRWRYTETAARMAALDTEVVMEINEIRPGMTCLTREGTAYVLEVDKQSLLVLLQREYETIPVQVRSDEILAPITR
ncbi:hypothetical protein EHZ77_17165 [Aeromonas dhakensis]|nr:hypothetical protein CK627_10245 [Aeromonas dhakensis]MBW3730389.1 hypothetical protein [Aeromonas dhakensis]QSR55093.1 hypothetical protein GO601_06415 [Aeromonas dhakensis]RQM81360.1 hypothetical protein EHZ77_17165 [Aeromonas dhakensis]TNI28427.1 hypothetical protein CF131_19205 [Aeromonas dhakensis]